MFHDDPANERMPVCATWRIVRRIAGVLLLGCLLEAGAAGASTNPEDSVSTGRSMFLGDSPLQGAIASHAELLPPRAVSCANCHLGTAGLGSGASFAPVLNRSGMTQPRGRRGGPPSVFSSASFCRMLRTGVDPAFILITRQMPRYTLSDDQCQDLWRYLMEANNEPATK